MFVHKVGECAMPFGCIADNSGGLSIARPIFEPFESCQDAIILCRIHIVGFPSERTENIIQLRHGKDHAIMNIELTVVAVYKNTEVVEMVLPGVHHGFPDSSFL